LPTIQVSSGVQVEVVPCPTPQDYVDFVLQNVLSHPATFFRKREDCKVWVMAVVEVDFLSRMDAETIAEYARAKQNWVLKVAPESYCDKLSEILDKVTEPKKRVDLVQRWSAKVAGLTSGETAEVLARFTHLCRNFSKR
jgi:hypothetical protein